MKKICLLLMVTLLFTATAFAQQGQFQRREANTLSEREKTAEFELLFDGKTISPDIWQGAVDKYKVVDGTMVCDPGGNLLTKKEYKDFVLRFDFKLPPGGNNGVGIRTKTGVDAAYNGHEIQILDDTADQYKNLLPYQYHGSIYRFVPAKKGSLRPVGQWNTETIIVYGNKVKVVCNGQEIVDADMTDFIKGDKPSLDPDHAHLFNETGVIGFLGHGDPVAFRNVRVKELKNEEDYNTYNQVRTQNQARTQNRRTRANAN